ncbi:MAG: hypothetical protein AAFX40_00740 [Cyanobacteria bacterium J06639_1]
MESDFDLTTALRQLCRAATPLAAASGTLRNRAIAAIATSLKQNAATILEANTLDLETLRGEDLPAWELDSLKLTPERLHHLAEQLDRVAGFADPIGGGDRLQTFESRQSLTQQRVPLGTLALAYEVYPEWCLSGISMALKTGNSVIVANDGPLQATQDAMADIASTAAYEVGIPEGAIQSIPGGQTEHFISLLRQSRYLELVLACGRRAWVESIAEMATVATLRAELPQCSIYIDASATWEQVWQSVLQHPSLPDCRESANADKRLTHHVPHAQFLLHADWAQEYLGAFLTQLQQQDCAIQAEVSTSTKSDTTLPLERSQLRVETVADVDEAIATITSSDIPAAAIVTDSRSRARQFSRQLKTSAVFVNQFPDVAELARQTTGVFLGWGAAPLSARGIIDFRALTAVKYLAEGD